MDDQKPKHATDSSSNGKSSKRKRKAPQKGEEGYLTPTQLRNARKRRAKKKKKKGRTQEHVSSQDPSQLYLSNPQAAPVVQAARTFFLSLNKQFPVTVGPCRGWRTVAKLAVRSATDGQVSIGLFAPNSHQLIPVPQCVAHHPSINASVTVLEKLCRQVNVTPFDERSGQGQLRFVSVNVERATGKVQLTLVWNLEPEASDGVLESLCRVIIGAGGGRPTQRKRRRGRTGDTTETSSISATAGEKPLPGQAKLSLHSLWVHYNASSKHSNAIFSIDGGNESWVLRYGPTCIVEWLDLRAAGQKDSVPLQFPPNVFRQANLDAFAGIVARIRHFLRDFRLAQPTCVELYGGVGTIGLNMADVVSSLVSSDENPFNLESFTNAALQLPETLQKRLSYEPKNASDMVHRGVLDDAQLVIVDPPRKGLDSDVLKALCESNTPQLLIYVSCGFDAFQRDCNALLHAQNWVLGDVEGHILFPGSDAIETLAFFVRN